MCIRASAALGRRISKGLTFILAFPWPPALRVAEITWGISAASLLINLKARGLVSRIPAAPGARRCQGLMHQARALCTAAHGDLGLGGHLAGDRKAGPLPPSGTWMPELPACSSPTTTGVPDGSSQAPSGAAPPIPGAIRGISPAPWERGHPLCLVQPITAVSSPGQLWGGSGPHALRRQCHQPPAEMQMQRNGRCD